jgi:hypothetical protein
MAIRLVYGRAVETLFAILGAAIQAPNCPIGWILSYTGPQLYALVRKVGGSQHGPLLARDGKLEGWDELSRRIHQFTHPDPREDERIKDLFASTWARLAREFLDPLTGDEYNSIKHGSRARAGGFSLTIGPSSSGAPMIESKSEFGAKFFHAVKLGDRVNFYAQDAMRNWSPEALAVRVELIAVSIQNVVSYLRSYIGISSTGQVTFHWPEATPALDLAWQADFVFESGTGGYVLEADDIDPVSAAQVLQGYEGLDGTPSPRT